MKKIIFIIVSLMLLVAFPFNAFGSNEDIEVEYTYKGSQQMRYPNLGDEYIIGPNENYYYIDFYDEKGNFVKTQEVRYADKFIIREAYDDGTKKVFPSKPLSKEAYDSYCAKYGYKEPTKTSNTGSFPTVEIKPSTKPVVTQSKPSNTTTQSKPVTQTKKPVVSEKSSTKTNTTKTEVKTEQPKIEEVKVKGEVKKVSLTEARDSFISLYKENKIGSLFNKVFKIGTKWSVDTRTIDVINFLSAGKINNTVVSPKEFTGSTKNTQDTIEKIVSEYDIDIVEVYILPYESAEFKNGYTFNFRGVDEHPVIVLFNNEMPMEQQLQIQLNELKK